MAHDTLWELTKTLCELIGPSGYEKPVMDWLEAAWRPYVSEIRRQSIGNLIAHVPGRGPKLLLSAHADELCFMVRAIQKDGFLWVAMSTPPDDRFTGGLNQVGLAVRVLLDDGRALPGIFGAAVGHVVTEKQHTAEKRWDEIFVDIGAQSDEEARSWGVHVGTKVTYEGASRQIGHYAIAKALDDRGGLAILTKLLQDLDPDQLTYDLYLASSTQEELGIIGASAICPEVRPDLAIEVDIGLAGDIPTSSLESVPVRLGGGPALIYRDAMVVYDQDITNALRRIGEREGIPTQPALYYHFGSDGLAFIRAGVRTALLTFPARYTHSPFEMVSLDDLEQATQLLKAFVTSPPAT
jgi:putative aminopeptidase FrvX